MIHLRVRVKCFLCVLAWMAPFVVDIGHRGGVEALRRHTAYVITITT